MKTIFITLLSLSSYVSAADFKLPFEMGSIDLQSEAEVKILIPTAVESSRFYREIQNDCSEFLSQIKEWNDNRVQIGSEDYQEIRKMPLALSMKPDYQLRLKIDLDLSSRNFLTHLKFVPKKVRFSFAKQASTPREFQKNYREDFSIEVLSGDPVLTFKSRDLFCDFQKGDLKLFYNSDLHLKLENNRHHSIVEKMTNVVEKLNDSLKFSDKPELQAVLFGYLTAQEKSKDLKEHLVYIFEELLEPGLMHPKKFWSAAEADFFKVDYSQVHVLENKEIMLKRAEYE